MAHIILTHGHFDHAGGCAALRAALPAARVYASAVIADVIREGDDAVFSLDIARAIDAYPAGSTLQPCPVDVELREGDTIAVGDVSLSVIDTPGHSDGHIALVLDDGPARSLFAGDVVFAGGNDRAAADVRLSRDARTSTRCASCATWMSRACSPATSPSA